MATAFEHWDGSEEKARERRIAERRERVQERLRLQQQRAKQDGSSAATPGAEQQAPSKGKQQAQQSTVAVAQLLEQARATVEAVRQAAEQRTDQHREACDAQEAALRERVSEEAEASRRENRGIDLEWEQLQGIKDPQALHAGILAVSEHCQRVLQSKDGVVGAVTALLRERDGQYIRLLQVQSEETDALIASMHQEYDKFKAAQEKELEAVEAAYMQERGELLAAQKADLDVLLEKRSALEQEFMEQYLAACEQYENELERLRAEGVQEHVVLKRRLDSEVAALETHLDGIKAAYMLNADKLDYNYRVLLERERESKEALMQQKRKITRQWEVLNRLKKRYGALDARMAADNARLSDEYQHVTRAFNHLQSKFRHFKAADLARFDKVREMKEEELGELLQQLLEAEHFIESYVVGLPEASSDSSAAAGDGDGNNDAGSVEGGGLVGLELVGRAVAVGVDPVAAAAGPASLGTADEALEAGKLIPAYHPASPEPAAAAAAATEAGGPSGSLAGLDPVAFQELKASVESGALSLLLAADGKQLQAQKLRELVAQVPAGAADEQQVTAGAVARSLGLQQRSTVAALELLFAGSSSLAGAAAAAAPDALAETIRPKDAAAEARTAADEAGRSLLGRPVAPAVPPPAFSRQQVEQGLGRLMQLLDAAATGGSEPGIAKAPRTADAGAQAAAPTSKQYWQSRVDAAVPMAVLRSWELLERQAGKQLATLQSRSTTADEVLALRQENEELKASLTALLTSPVNKELQLPPTLLLR